jgi:hypothetical protein
MAAAREHLASIAADDVRHAVEKFYVAGSVILERQSSMRIRRPAPPIISCSCGGNDDDGFTRRALVAGAGRPVSIVTRSQAAAAFLNPLDRTGRTGGARTPSRSSITSPATSSLHLRLVEMWAAIGAETGGRVEALVFPLKQIPEATGGAEDARRRRSSSSR